MTRIAMKETIHYAWAQSALGEFLIAKSASGLVALEFGDRAGNLVEELRVRFTDAGIIEDGEDLADETARAIRLIEDPCAGTTLQPDPRGTEFELRVWSELRNVQPGHTVMEKWPPPSARRAARRTW